MESKGIDKRQKFDDNQQISTWDDNHSVKEVDPDKAVSIAETNDNSHDVDFPSGPTTRLDCMVVVIKCQTVTVTILVPLLPQW